MATKILSPCMRHVGLSTIQTLPVLITQPARLASKKASGAVRNKIGSTRHKFRGIKADDGSFVHKGDIIVTQFGLRFYPGENVQLEDNWTLTAAYDGIVVRSTEQLNPYPDSPLYPHIQKGFVMQKQFFSVIPTPLHGKFKLISET